MKPFSTKGTPERAVLIGLSHRDQPAEKLEEYLDELEFLATTLGVVTVKRFTQSLETPNPATFVGSGKLTEIKAYVKDNDIDVLIFDDDLSPSQIRNVEKAIKKKNLR